ncbi:MAG: hypothetical protein V4487_05125 [Chlamydiota bacterium]
MSLGLSRISEHYNSFKFSSKATEQWGKGRDIRILTNKTKEEFVKTLTKDTGVRIFATYKGLGKALKEDLEPYDADTAYFTIIQDSEKDLILDVFYAQFPNFRNYRESHKNSRQKYSLAEALGQTKKDYRSPNEFVIHLE